jgi:hypothetical protein
MSGNRKEMVRFDFESAVTRRYDRREMAAAMAAWYPALALYTVQLESSLAHLAVHNGMLSEDNDLAWRRNHEGGHHGRRLLAAHV